MPLALGVALPPVRPGCGTTVTLNPSPDPEAPVPKIEVVIKDAIQRGARRQIRLVATPLRRDVRRLRRIVAGLRKDLTALRATAAQWARMAAHTPWTATVSDEAVKAARLSPRLIQKLRARLGLSQTALARLVGVTGTAVVQWEQGRASPSGDRRKAVVALRKFGRREVTRLLAQIPSPAAKRRRRRRKGQRRARRRGSQD
jgi:DNA-binding transcriptional regulator YiaG